MMMCSVQELPVVSPVSTSPHDMYTYFLPVVKYVFSVHVDQYSHVGGTVPKSTSMASKQLADHGDGKEPPKMDGKSLSTMDCFI